MAYMLKIKNRYYICETKNGKRTYLESFSNEESADKYLKKLKGGGSPPVKMTVAELFEQYIEKKNWSVTTLRNSRYVIQSYILPKLGKIRLSQLEPQECENFITSIKTQKLKNNRTAADLPLYGCFFSTDGRSFNLRLGLWEFQFLLHFFQKP